MSNWKLGTNIFLANVPLQLSPHKQITYSPIHYSCTYIAPSANISEILFSSLFVQISSRCLTHLSYAMFLYDAYFLFFSQVTYRLWQRSHWFKEFLINLYSIHNLIDLRQCWIIQLWLMLRNIAWRAIYRCYFDLKSQLKTVVTPYFSTHVSYQI